MPYLQLSDGRTVPVEGTNFVIGADPVCDLTLQDEGVAPRHAILQFDDDVWRLATLSLQSETKLNGEPVESIVALQDGDELAFGSASLRWLEKEPVQAKRFPVWVPVVLLFFACVTVLGLWTLFNRDNQVADRTTIALTAEEVALATQQAEDASGQDTEVSSPTSADATATGDENGSNGEQQGESASDVTPTPAYLKAPAPSEPSAESESEEATTAEETTTEPASEAVTEPACPHPDDWVQMTVEQGQKLRDIARTAKTQPRIIVEANCLPNTKVKAGIVLWVPIWEGVVPVAVADTTAETGSEAATTEETASEAESGDAVEVESAAAAETTETAEVTEVEASESGEAAATEEMASDTESGDATEAESEVSEVTEGAESAEAAEATESTDTEEAATEATESAESSETAETEEVAATEEATEASETEAAEAEDSCPTPDGWVQMTVKAGQKVRDIAKIAGTTPRKIKDANCLPNYTITAGDMLWVPQWEPEVDDEETTTESAEVTESSEATETETEAEDSCPVPDGWVQMTVEAGQKVRDIAKIAGTTPRKIKEANCLPDYTISAGDMLWVPQWEPEVDDEETTTESAEVTESSEATETETEAEDSCPVPDGWEPATIEEDMKLKDIAEILGSKARVIKEGNCLPSYKVTPGQVIWVPLSLDPLDRDAETVVDDIAKCPYPENWVQMTVQKGQKLRDIAHAIGVQPWEIKVANCLPDTKVQVGMILWVPRWGGKG